MLIRTEEHVSMLLSNSSTSRSYSCCQCDGRLEDIDKGKAHTLDERHVC